MTPHAHGPGRASRHAEALIEQHSVPPLHEAVGARGADLGGSMLDPFHRGEQFVRMHFRTTAELTTVVGEDRLNRNAQQFVEGKHPVVEQVARSDRHLRVVEFDECERAVAVHDYLDIDFAHAFQGSPIEGVLIEQLAGTGRLDVPALESVEERVDPQLARRMTQDVSKNWGEGQQFISSLPTEIISLTNLCLHL